MKARQHIQTDRLDLSRPLPEDAQAVFTRYASDPDVTRYVGWPMHRLIDDTRSFLAFCDSQWDASPAGPYLIRSRSTGDLLGSTGLSFDNPSVAMTGYVLAKDAWGQGYATEALAAMIDLARGLGLSRIYALCHPEHIASQRVLEKCSFILDETFAKQFEFPNLQPGVLQEVLCYEMTFPRSGGKLIMKKDELYSLRDNCLERLEEGRMTAGEAEYNLIKLMVSADSDETAFELCVNLPKEFRDAFEQNLREMMEANNFYRRTFDWSNRSEEDVHLEATRHQELLVRLAPRILEQMAQES